MRPADRVLFTPDLLFIVTTRIILTGLFITYYILQKKILLTGSKDGNIRHTDIKRNSPSLFWIPHKCSVCPPFVTRETLIR
jgi:hypothetical protein